MAYDAVRDPDTSEPADTDEDMTSSAAAAALHSERLSAYAIGIESATYRLNLRMRDASATLRDDIAAIVSSLQAARSSVSQIARKLFALRCKVLDDQWDHAAAVEKQFSAFARCADLSIAAATHGRMVVSATYTDVSSLIHAATLLDTSIFLSIECDLQSVTSSFTASRVVSDFDSNACTCSGSGATMCRTYRAGCTPVENAITVKCVWPDSLPIRLAPEDLAVRLSDANSGAEVPFSYRVEALEESDVTVMYCVPEPTPLDIRLDISVCHAPLLPLHVPVAGRFTGTRIATIALNSRLHSRDNYAVAVSCCGGYLAVGNCMANVISVYALPSGEELSWFGGRGIDPGRFCNIRKLAFRPSGTLLVVENMNARVQEMRIDGKHVRFIGEGVITSSVWGIAVNSSLIAVGSGRSGPQVYLFEADSGRFMHSFGTYGKLPGSTRGCVAIRFVDSGQRMVIAELDNWRLSVYSVDGTFLHCLLSELHAQPFDVECVGDNQLLVACADAGALVLLPLALDGTQTIIHTSSQHQLGQSDKPVGLAISGCFLFVLDNASPRVDVYR